MNATLTKDLKHLLKGDSIITQQQTVVYYQLILIFCPE